MNGAADAPMSSLEYAYNYKFGDYVDLAGDLMRFNDFMRWCAKDGDMFYYGGLVEFHYWGGETYVS